MAYENVRVILNRTHGLPLETKKQLRDMFEQVYADTQATITPGTAITDASTAHALNAVFSDTEVEAALNALGTKINSVIAALETAGIISA